MHDATYRFADFELNLAEGELRTGNSSVRIQGKPLLLLSVLLDNPQRLVTREQLRERMWDARTVVDFEQGINVAMRKLRESLGDSAEAPRFIETVARKGYRFLLPVSVASRDAAAPAKVGAAAIGPGEIGPGEIGAGVIGAGVIGAGAIGPLPIAERPAVPEVIADGVPSVRRRWWFWAAAATGLGALGLGISWTTMRPRHAQPIRSLAVLPLRDLSPDSGQEYFADGITEDVITNLAQTLPLRVISRTSVMRYKHTGEPITQIARELGVEAIVEGAVARSADRVSVTVQLIDATEDRHLWAQKYDRHLADTMAMEAELSQSIAGQVSGALKIKHVEPTRLSPIDPQVYELYLLGRYHWNKRTEADLAKAEDYFKQAAARYPMYAPAYAGLADVYAMQPGYGIVAWEDTFAKATAAARHALELDDSLAEAHATLGFVDLNTPHWKQSEQELRRALELNPNYASAHIWFAFFLAFSGRRDEALAESELARQLDPLSASINAHEAHFLYAARRFEEAKARARQAIELAPDLAEPHNTLAFIALESGQAAEALSEARAGLALQPDSVRAMGETGYVLASTGHTADAQKLLATLKELAHRGASSPTYPALIETGLGQLDQALETLAEAVDSSGKLWYSGGLGQWHGFEVLFTDPRYQKLLADVPAD